MNLNHFGQQSLISQISRRAFSNIKQKLDNQKIGIKRGGVYTVKYENVYRLQNGYYLLFYHRQRFFTMTLLYLRFIIPLVGLGYLIKKNPFYKSFPAALPLMSIVFFLVLY